MKKNNLILCVIILLSHLRLDSVITIDPVVVQNMGVRVSEVKIGNVHRTIRALGNIDIPEPNIAVINLKYSGWIKELLVSETGKTVRKGDALFTIHSPELMLAQDEYLLADKNNDRSLKNSAQDRLQFFGLTKKEIKELSKQKEAPETYTVRSPLDGFVLSKSVDEGAKANTGSDLFKIGNLKKVWVNANVYEFDAPFVRIGAKAKMELSYIPGHNYEGHVSFIHPTLDEKNHTLKVRMEFKNPGLFLRPNMFATAKIESQVQSNVLVIPNEAIIYSGDNTNVFVAKEKGHYELRKIEPGLVGSNNYTEIVSGLKQGELVVTSGQFLLDSESQMQEAVNKMLGHGLHSAHKGSTSSKENPPLQEIWTCPMHPEVIKNEPGQCPICHMDLVKKTRVKSSVNSSAASHKHHEKKMQMKNDANKKEVKRHSPKKNIPKEKTESLSHKKTAAEKESKKEQQSYFTCPMHPQIVSEKPGTCPICKMDLVEKKR